MSEFLARGIKGFLKREAKLTLDMGSLAEDAGIKLMPRWSKCYSSSLCKNKRFAALLVFCHYFADAVYGRSLGSPATRLSGKTAAVVVSWNRIAFMKNQSFNMGYYANCPDFIWKRPATYDFESRSTLWIWISLLTAPLSIIRKSKTGLELSRKIWTLPFPEVKQDAGREFWRIREFFARFERVTAQLRELKEPTGEARQKLQENGFLVAGLMASTTWAIFPMPLHVSENHDGR